MAGRIRTIKPEMLEDEHVACLSLVAFKLFIGCILSADDYGNLRGASGVLLGRIFWHESEQETLLAGDVSAALAELVSCGLLEPYRVRGQKYVSIRNWNKHQRVDKPGKALCPGPTEGEKMSPSEFLGGIREGVANGSRGIPGGLATDLEDDQRPTTNERTTERPSPPEPVAPPSPPEPSAGSDEPALVLGLPEVESPRLKPADRIFAVFLTGWRLVIGVGRPPLLTSDRRKLVDRRLKDGYDEAQLCAAADGIWRSEWHVREKRTDFDLVFRNAEHVERFAALAPVAPVQREQAPEAPAAPSARLLAFVAAQGASAPEDAATGQPEALAAILGTIGRRAS